MTFGLSLFLLFPIVFQSLHQLEHLGEEHCTVQVIHFDQDGNHCELCDIVPLTVDTPPRINPITAPFIAHDYILSLRQEAILQYPHFSFLLRGPPLSLV